MPTIQLPRDSFSRELDRRIAMFEDFEISITSKTCSITGGAEKYFFSDSNFSKRVFPMAKAVKKQIEESGITAPHFNPSDVKYYRFAEDLPEYQAKAYGYDINKAYLAALFNVGYINQELFKKLCELPKMDRLAIIGMLATSKTIYQFSRGEMIDARIEEDSKMRNVFFHISFIVGLCLDDVFSKHNAFMYWVDGIITPVPIDTRQFFAHGFDIKTEKIEHFTARKFEKQNLIHIKYTKEENEKSFQVSKTIFLHNNKSKLFF